MNIINLQPEFFDIFGLIAFLFIVAFSFWALKVKKPRKRIPRYIFIALFIIGILGVLVDSIIVFINYVL